MDKLYKCVSNDSYDIVNGELYGVQYYSMNLKQQRI